MAPTPPSPSPRRKANAPFDGIVTEARWLGSGDNGHRYRLRLRPWAFLASLRRNQRIFHNKTVVEILTELLSAYADAGALTVELANDYPELEYTVQYRESDLAFACRMMERHGISYHFRHADGAHEMVLTDQVEAHDSIGARPFRPAEGHHQEEVSHFRAWRPARRITTGAIRLTDYNFKTPVAAMETDHLGDAAYEQGQIESFDWPGDYLDQGRGRVVAELRAAGERGQDRRFEAEGDIVALGAGFRVTLSGDPVPGTGGEYMCLSARHSYTADNYGSGGSDDGDGRAYDGQYVLMPVEAPLLPEQKTARADVRGPQTATVVGEGEIDCDEYGRILVRFHWDLDEAWSMRCRVSQSWAGAGWGGMVIPHIGMEVVVEFLDGDPDKPLVTGCVYNGRNPVPYDLPANKTKSVFRSDMHTGVGFNELRFEDETGREEVFVHAERDLHVGVENDHRTSVGGNLHRQVRGHETALTYGEHVSHSLALRGITTGDTLLIASGNSETVRPVSPRAFVFGDGNLRDQKHPRMNLGHARSVQRGSMLLHAAADMVISSDDEFQIQSDNSLRLASPDTLSVTTPADLKMSSQERVIVEASNGIVFNSESGIVLRSGKSRIRLSPSGKIEIDGSEVIVKGDKICLN
ncbi:type VI secretion system tip protein VgrG [Rhodovulum sulfidophilum]|uniref:type VI secretion system tip protein TssI/VgrG n=1 Tax=Rhodovulum sulfidophilum TaxID=35806 RepID=UPI001F2EC42C|nr:type VI secretion system tip protein TssI/VgrG [Rhodovulum sulfidophilum]MCE8433103.1 type VI secretion system tip protein VgrG [Rhodovulum sulfidophilum]MCF4115254.1 type VI secretion system tip protein VgrG [Rhodovulum sulfidophilum]